MRSAQLRLARHLDGTLGVVEDYADHLPESVLAASATAAVALRGWDLSTGSFRHAGDHEFVVPDGRAIAVGAARATSPDAELLAHAAAEMARRLDELAAACTLDPAHRQDGALSATPLTALARESRSLQERRLAPLAFSARDGVYRDHAMRLSRAAVDLAADHLDTVDPAQLAVGRTALEAGRAAQEYLTLSDAIAASVRSRRMVRPAGNLGGDHLEAALAALRQLDQALRHQPLSDVAIAEWCAFTADLEWAGATRNALHSTGREAQLRRVAVDRRLADTVCGLVRGDLGAHLATLPEGRYVLGVVAGVRERFDAELGLARGPAPAHARRAGEWLAADGTSAHAFTHTAALAPRVQACRNVVPGRSATRHHGHGAGM